MLYGVFGDVHGNLEALTEVLGFFDKAGVEGYIFCGDLVGYGPDPEACVQLIRGLRKSIMPVCGNHDQAALGVIDPNWFNPYARQAVLWSRKMISEESRTFLSRLGARLDGRLFTIAHGSPRRPAEEYMLTAATFKENMPKVPVWPLFVGHSHMPLYMRIRTEHGAREGDVELDTIDDRKVVTGERKPFGVVPIVFNPGSVGQPRDQDWRACCGLYDSDALTFRIVRLEYNIALAQQKIRDAGLPEFLALRLAFGQ
ncbi:MAG: metallophosphoesterase family protein [Elusimicrobia bacterium]|nr:metallophosphoesterase family protein [Elusimicrobiota bacterium]